MKTYRKPVTKTIGLNEELLLGTSDTIGDSGTKQNFSKRQGFIYDDEDDDL